MTRFVLPAMKLRIDDHSLRLRLSASDVAALEESGNVDLVTAFSSEAVLTVRLRTTASNCIGASFGDGTITVDLPETYVRGWGQSDRVGFEEVQPTGTGNPLRIVVEKDLDCRHGERSISTSKQRGETGLS